jgi:hypothetical protein
MGSFLQKLLTNPEDFKFYTGNQKGAVSPNNKTLEQSLLDVIELEEKIVINHILKKDY